MKNIFVFWDEPLNPVGGGIHRCIINLINNLPSRGYNVEYLFSRDHYKTFVYTTHDNNEMIIPLDGLKDFLQEKGCNIILGQEAVYSSSFTEAVVSLNLDGIRFINQYHSTPLYFHKKLTWDYLREEWINANSLKYKFGLLLRACSYPIWRWHVKNKQNQIYRYNYQNSDLTLLLSEYEIPHFRKICGDPNLSKCLCIPNPLSWPEIASPEIIKQKKKEILIVSRIYNCEKRIDLALKVWKMLQDQKLTDGWSLRIVGEGISKPYLKDLANKLNLENVFWEGRQNPIPFYERASIFLLTSVVEGWALTLTESMQMGVVPVAFDSYPAVRNIITDGYDGFLVPTKDLEMLSDRLSEIMMDTDKREKMALNCLASCRRFSIDKVMDKWREMLAGLLLV